MKKARKRTDVGHLAGRRILITGAASGMGRAISRRFHDEGAALALADVAADALNAFAGTIRAWAVVADVSCEDEVRALVENAERHLGGLDGVVNAAGVLAGAPIAETDAALWHRLLDINLLGPAAVCRHAAPALLREQHSTIVNICSNASLKPTMGFGAYAASKAALLSLTRSLALELGPSLRANAILPGPIRTPMIAHLGDADSARSEAVLGASKALKRIGEPEEVAAAALFLTSAESSYMTGDSIVLDGGAAYR